YFASDEDAQAFEDELTHILLNQMAAFNSPVWFNVGFEEQPQCSACFILSVEDTMESILDWNTREGRNDQVGRQDPPRGEDGRPRRRPPGHPRLHLVQGQGGGQGRGPRTRGL